MPVAKLQKRETLNKSTESLSFVMEEDLGFIGGQYIILDSKIPMNEEKNFKRAYTIASSDEEQRSFRIVYKRLGEGLVTNQFLDNLKIGQEVSFSGPWGKFLKNEAFAKEGKTLMVATDTGIASAMSFLSSKRVKNRLKDVDLKWFVPSKDYFISHDEISEKFSGALGSLEIKAIPEYGKGRDEEFYRSLESFMEETSYNSYFLCGDGEVVRRGKELLLKRGHDETQIGTKVYFNK